MSGAEETIDEILKVLVCADFDVISLSCIERFLLYQRDYSRALSDEQIVVLDGYKKYILCNPKNYNNLLKELTKEFSPDIILTQLFDVSTIRKIVGNTVPIVCLIHGVIDNESQIQFAGADTYVCLSNYIARKLPFENVKSFTIYPLIPKEKYLVGQRCCGDEKILFINPIKCKGVEIVFHLAEKFKSEQFLIYENWKQTDLRYKKIIEQIDNVEIKPVSSNPKEIYKNVKLLLVPSQIEEGFGRCVIEANINSIPVVASRVGGLEEAVGEEQTLIEEYKCEFAWENAVGKILYDNTYYWRLSRNAYINSKLFESKAAIIDVFNEIYSDLCR